MNLLESYRSLLESVKVTSNTDGYLEYLRGAMDDRIEDADEAIKKKERTLRRWRGELETETDEEYAGKLRKLIRYAEKDIEEYRTGKGFYDQAAADRDFKHYSGEARKAIKAAADEVQRAVKRAGHRWTGSKVAVAGVIDDSFYSEDPYTPTTFTVYVHHGGRLNMAPSFTIWDPDYKPQEVLDAGDRDFFKDPKLEADYFSLVQEMAKPGSTKSKGRVITLYTARPTKDRKLYTNAKTIPSGVFLTTSFDRAEGIGSDLSGGRGRDIWLVRVKDTYLIQTLKTSRVRDFQAFHSSGKVPVEKMELV